MPPDLATRPADHRAAVIAALANQAAPAAAPAVAGPTHKIGITGGAPVGEINADQLQIGPEEYPGDEGSAVDDLIASMILAENPTPTIPYTAIGPAIQNIAGALFGKARDERKMADKDKWEAGRAAQVDKLVKAMSEGGNNAVRDVLMESGDPNAIREGVSLTAAANEKARKEAMRKDGTVNVNSGYFAALGARILDDPASVSQDDIDLYNRSLGRKVVGKKSGGSGVADPRVAKHRADWEAEAAKRGWTKEYMERGWKAQEGKIKSHYGL